jgi:hypothetical protein
MLAGSRWRLSEGENQMAEVSEELPLDRRQLRAERRDERGGKPVEQYWNSKRIGALAVLREMSGSITHDTRRSVQVTRTPSEVLPAQPTCRSPSSRLSNSATRFQLANVGVTKSPRTF